MAEKPSEPLAPGTRLDDKYIVVGHIKTGGMGAVYEVEHGPLGKRLAAKLLLPELVRRPELLERFRREARAASATGHENIVEVTDLGETRGGVPFLIMELLVGRTLGTELKDGPLPPERAVHIARQILSALKAAHGRGIVHRDLKPENIFLIQRAGDPDFVKVLDFGIAKMIDEAPGQELTQAGQVVGTPTYMSPEQARGGEIDARTDVYATGAILYRMITGQRPFTAPTFNALLFAIAQGNPTAPRTHSPACTEALEAAILRAMAVDPRTRYQNAEQFDEALAEDDLTSRRTKAGPRKTPEIDATSPGKSKSRDTHDLTHLDGKRPGGGTVVRRVVGRAMTWGILLGLLVILGGSTWIVLRRVLKLRDVVSLRDEAADTRARVLGEPPPAGVVVTLDVSPPGVKLSIDGASVAGPVLTLPRDGKRHVIKATLAGYDTQERPFLAASDQTLSLHLKKRKPQAAKAVDGVDDAQVKQLEKLIQKLGEE